MKQMNKKENIKKVLVTQTYFPGQTADFKLTEEHKASRNRSTEILEEAKAESDLLLKPGLHDGWKKNTSYKKLILNVSLHEMDNDKIIREFGQFVNNEAPKASFDGDSSF